MPERRRDDERPEHPVEPPADGGYTADEEAEVQKRLEDLGYVE
jgi:hypothetical protein